MGRAPCCEKIGLKKGRWTAEEDDILTKYIQDNGEGSWRSLPKNAGLLRCGKSCRLRWLNYLRNDLKRGNISSEEEELIIRLHSSLGNRWSLIAGHLPGRTDNEIKNHWNSHLSRRIHSFRRPTISSESIPLIMNLTKIKRKGGRTSRAAMKSNKKQSNSGTSSNMSNSVETTTSGGAAANQGALMENKTQLIKNGSSPTTIVGQTEQEEILMTVDPSDIVRESEMCCRSSPNEGRGSCTELGPYEAAGIMCPNDIMGNGMNDLNDILTFTDDSSENGFIEFNEGRESGVMGSNDTRTISEEGGGSGSRGGAGGDDTSTGGLSSNHHISTGENGEWYSSSSINSCFEDEWVDWDWVGVCVEQSHHKLWEDGEEMLSWCWQSSN